MAHRRFIAVVLALAIALSTLVAAYAAPVASADEAACPAQLAALQGTLAKIDEHNARALPGGVGPPEIVRPYNREADQLDAERAANLQRLQACATVTNKLQAGGPPTKPLGERALDSLRQAKAQVPAGWTAPRPLPTLGTRITIPPDSPIKPLWDAVNKQKSPQYPYPDVALQGTPRPASTDIHASQPWKRIGTNAKGGPAVSADHIVPKVEIMYLPRFTELTPENMWQVLNAPLNLQWLPTAVNAKNKNSRSAADMQGVDPLWQKRQVELQGDKRRELTELIAQLADTQMP
jgi:hypothetical protein